MKLKDLIRNSGGKPEAMIEAYELLHGCIFARPTLTCWVRGIITDRKSTARDAKLKGYTDYIDFVVQQVCTFLTTIYYFSKL